VDKVPRDKWRERRVGVYDFLAKVPVDLLTRYAPKTEIKYSLKTRNLKQVVISGPGLGRLDCFLRF
jgi:hypothetical protein